MIKKPLFLCFVYKRIIFHLSFIKIINKHDQFQIYRDWKRHICMYIQYIALMMNFNNVKTSLYIF